MKYVITDHGHVAIGETTYHALLAEAVIGVVVGAGSMRIKNGRVEVYGRSSGYDMDAKPEDIVALERHLGIV